AGGLLELAGLVERRRQLEVPAIVLRADLHRAPVLGDRLVVPALRRVQLAEVEEDFLRRRVRRVLEGLLVLPLGELLPPRGVVHRAEVVARIGEVGIDLERLEQRLLRLLVAAGDEAELPVVAPQGGVPRLLVDRLTEDSERLR